MKNSFLRRMVLCCLLGATFISTAGFFKIGGSCKEKYKRQVQLSAPLAEGATLTAETDVGSIELIGADVADCNVTATICVRAPSQEQAKELAEKVQISLEPDGNNLRLKIEKPSKKRKCSICVSLDITVPKETCLQLESNIGEIEISGVASQIKAETDVGGIICKEIAGDIKLQTNVGKVTVRYSETTPSACSANIKTDVGCIDFTAPANLSAEVHAEADVGSIKTELPLTVTGMVGKELHGTIGKGEGKIYLKTDVGSIKIR